MHFARKLAKSRTFRSPVADPLSFPSSPEGSSGFGSTPGVDSPLQAGGASSHTWGDAAAVLCTLETALESASSPAVANALSALAMLDQQVAAESASQAKEAIAAAARAEKAGLWSAVDRARQQLQDVHLASTEREAVVGDVDRAIRAKDATTLDEALRQARQIGAWSAAGRAMQAIAAIRPARHSIAPEQASMSHSESPEPRPYPKFAAGARFPPTAQRPEPASQPPRSLPRSAPPPSAPSAPAATPAAPTVARPFGAAGAGPGGAARLLGPSGRPSSQPACAQDEPLPTPGEESPPGGVSPVMRSEPQRFRLDTPDELEPEEPRPQSSEDVPTATTTTPPSSDSRASPAARASPADIEYEPPADSPGADTETSIPRVPESAPSVPRIPQLAGVLYPVFRGTVRPTAPPTPAAAAPAFDAPRQAAPAAEVATGRPPGSSADETARRALQHSEGRELATSSPVPEAAPATRRQEAAGTPDRAEAAPASGTLTPALQRQPEAVVPEAPEPEPTARGAGTQLQAEGFGDAATRGAASSPPASGSPLAEEQAPDVCPLVESKSPPVSVIGPEAHTDLPSRDSEKDRGVGKGGDGGAPAAAQVPPMAAAAPVSAVAPEVCPLLESNAPAVSVTGPEASQLDHTDLPSRDGEQDSGVSDGGAGVAPATAEAPPVAAAAPMPAVAGQAVEENLAADAGYPQQKLGCWTASITEKVCGKGGASVDSFAPGTKDGCSEAKVPSCAAELPELDLGSGPERYIRMAELLEQKAQADFDQLRRSADDLLQEMHAGREECRKLAQRGHIRAWYPVIAACALVVCVQPIAVGHTAQRQALLDFAEWAHGVFPDNDRLSSIVPPPPPAAPSRLQRFLVWMLGWDRGATGSGSPDASAGGPGQKGADEGHAEAEADTAETKSSPEPAPSVEAGGEAAEDAGAAGDVGAFAGDGPGEIEAAAEAGGSWSRTWLGRWSPR